MGKWIYVAQLQVKASPWNFKLGKSIQCFQRYAFCKVWSQFVANLTSFLQVHMEKMGKCSWQCTTTSLENSTELRTEKIHQTVTDIWVPQVWQPPAHPVAQTMTTIPLEPGGLRGKMCNRRTDGRMDRSVLRAVWSQLKIQHLKIVCCVKLCMGHRSDIKSLFRDISKWIRDKCKWLDIYIIKDIFNYLYIYLIT